MTLIWLVALSGIVALDATAFGQLMLSRPLVAGTLAGAVVGLPFEGALTGALLEALSLSVLPVGAARYPETGTAAVAAVGALGVAGVTPGPAALLVTLLFALIWQRLAGATVVGGRYINERMVRAGREGAARMDRLIEHRHIETMLLDVLRGMLLTAGGLLVGVPALRLIIPAWSLSDVIAAAAVAAAAGAMLAATAPLFAESRRGRILLLAGVLSGSALLFVR